MMKMLNATEFRLMLYVKDFDGMRKFYEEILCFPVLKSWDRGPQDKGIMFDTGSGIIELLLPKEEWQPIQGCKVSLEVKDVRALWNELKNVTPVVFSLQDNPWGDTSFCITDPEGFHLTFFTKH